MKAQTRACRFGFAEIETLKRLIGAFASHLECRCSTDRDAAGVIADR